MGKAAALVSVFPGADVHELPGVELPSADAGATVPVVLPVIEPTMVTGTAVGRLGEIALIAGVAIAEPPVLVDVTLATDGESSTSFGEQFTLVPGSVGSCASGGDARVVTGAPETVVAENRLENGLGPARGDDTIAPAVGAIPVLVVLKTCAEQMLLLRRSTAAALRNVRIQIPGM